jgi:hypothetical protein
VQPVPGDLRRDLRPGPAIAGEHVSAGRSYAGNGLRAVSAGANPALGTECHPVLGPTFADRRFRGVPSLGDW